MTEKWFVQQVDICYPSDNLKDKVYAIELLSLTYNNYNLQLSFSDNKGFSLLIFNNKKPEILEDITGFERLLEITKKYNLPKVNKKIIFNDLTKFFICENDDDGNYDGITNGQLVKSGDYGIPITYESKYYIKDYEYNDKEDIKKSLENIIKEGVFECLTKFSVIKEKNL